MPVLCSDIFIHPLVEPLENQVEHTPTTKD